MSIHRILLPLDYGAWAAEATRIACDLARQYDAELHLLHVVEPWQPAAMASHSEPYPTQRAEEALAHFPLPRPTPKPVRREVRVGDIPQHILDYAQQENIDLIVMGTHGRTGVTRLLLGSVAENVLRHASCPVLLARAHMSPEETSPQEPEGLPPSSMPPSTP